MTLRQSTFSRMMCRNCKAVGMRALDELRVIASQWNNDHASIMAA